MLVHEGLFREFVMAICELECVLGDGDMGIFVWIGALIMHKTPVGVWLGIDMVFGGTCI